MTRFYLFCFFIFFTTNTGFAAAYDPDDDSDVEPKGIFESLQRDGYEKPSDCRMGKKIENPEYKNFIFKLAQIKNPTLTFVPLAVLSVGKDSYQRAFFADDLYWEKQKTSDTKNQIGNQIGKFKLIINPDKTVSIVCSNGETSYLAVNQVGEYIFPFGVLGYQPAIFATEKFLKDNKSYSKNFILIVEDEGTIKIKSKNGVTSYLASLKTDNGYNSAIFASKAYIQKYKYVRAMWGGSEIGRYKNGLHH